jgi:RNA polymerase sporulation-specific sigma factor
LRLVAHIIKKYYANSKDQEDLISIGTIGLIKAISTFNPNKGARLATYAARCIENEILMYFRSLKKSSADISISEPVDTDKDGNTISIFDIIYCEDDVAEQVDLNRNLALLRDSIKSCLDKREKDIICARYGLLGHRPSTQNEIAQKLKISRSYVSRIEKKALLKLRERFL